MTGTRAAAPTRTEPSRRTLLRSVLALSAAMLSGQAGAQTAGQSNGLRPALEPGARPDSRLGAASQPGGAGVPAAALPEVGRLTGRDNAASVEGVLAQRPDLILDHGSVGATYVSLANRVQAQTGVPGLLLDGTLARIPETYALLGEILDRRPAAAVRADAAARLGDWPCRLDQHRDPGVRRGRERRRAQPGGGWAQVSAKRVLAWDPDWVVAADPRFFAAAPGRSRTRR